MFVVQRMALPSHSLFTFSLRLSTNAASISRSSFFPLHSPSKTLFSISRTAFQRQIRVLALYHKRNGVSTSSAVATESIETASIAEDKEEISTEKIVLPTNDSSESLLRIRHTCAHVMAMAVQRIYPDAKVTIGPWIECGFYYDFDMEPLTDTDLKRIKKEMGTEFIS
ncbi:hypothetical protein CsSME_00019119 [Camellia sinensis var. sinensis]